MAEGTISRAIAAGRLFEVHPGVYSVVPLELMTVDAWHAAAVLAGGRAACLCEASAGWWLKVFSRPAAIHVAVTSTLTPIAGIVWHELGLRPEERGSARGMPVTSPARVAIDLAPRLGEWDLRGLLAELEYHHGVHPEDIAALIRRGRAGGAKLRRAIAAHTPQLAATRSELERAYARLTTERGFVLPEFNHPAGLSTVDAVYEEQRVVVELDGVRGHTGERRILRDHRRDLHRRREGFTPLRYHYTQILEDGDLIEAELDRLGIPRSARTGP